MLNRIISQLAALIVLSSSCLEGQNLAVNGNMEGGFGTSTFQSSCWYSASQYPLGWTVSSQTNNAKVTRETGTYHSSNNSMRIFYCGYANHPGLFVVAHQSINVGANAAFRMKIWARWDNGNCPAVMGWNPGADQGDPTTAFNAGRLYRVNDENWFNQNRWVSRTIYGQADASGIVTVMAGGTAYPGAAGGSVFIDDLEVTNISDTLKNGSFEQGNFDNNGDFLYWDVSNGSMGLDYPRVAGANQGYDNPGNPVDGLKYAYTDSCGDDKESIISQPVQVMLGVPYTLQAYIYAPPGLDPDMPRIGVVNGAIYPATTPTLLHSATLATRGAWTPVSLVFTPTSRVITVVLYGKHTLLNCWGAYFDNVTLTPNCIPPTVP